jgi:hypothetical protein
MLTVSLADQAEPGARIYRPRFHENKPKTLVFSHSKRAFWACFRESRVYNFGHRQRPQKIASLDHPYHHIKTVLELLAVSPLICHFL